MIILGIAGHTGTFQGILQVHSIGIEVAHIGLSFLELAQGDYQQFVGNSYNKVILPLV